MKKIFFTSLFLLIVAFLVNAQDTTMVEQYCKLTASGKIFSNKLHVALDFGDVERNGIKIIDYATNAPVNQKNSIL